MNMCRKNTCACSVDRVGISRRYKRVHTVNRELNGTNRDNTIIRWWGSTGLALFPADEQLELSVAVEERVELGEDRYGLAAEVVWFVVVRVGDGVAEDVKCVVCMWVRLGGWTSVDVWGR